jgi:hypothetical protein
MPDVFGGKKPASQLGPNVSHFDTCLMYSRKKCTAQPAQNRDNAKLVQQNAPAVNGASYRTT